MTNHGRYIVLEGDEGAGKTTQIELLQRRLTEQGIRCAFVREPGGDPLAEQLREIVKHSPEAITPKAEVALFSAARASLLANVIRPHLDAGTWVLSDRSYLSSLVYQGKGRGLDSPLFREVVAYFAAECIPDVTVVLDIEPAHSQQRLNSRSEALDRFEKESSAFRRRVNQAYHDLAIQLGFELVDGSQTREEVHEAIWQFVAPLTNQSIS